MGNAGTTRSIATRKARNPSCPETTVGAIARKRLQTFLLNSLLLMPLLAPGPAISLCFRVTLKYAGARSTKDPQVGLVWRCVA